MTRRLIFPKDEDGHPTNLMPLNDPQTVDGSAASVASAAIDGQAVRIYAAGTEIHFLIGDVVEGVDPVVTNQTGFPVAANNEIYQPCKPGQKIAIIGGIARIATVGI